MNWEEAARRFLGSEKVARDYLKPEPTGVFVEWRRGIYVGHMQVIVPNYSPEIVVLSKTSEPLDMQFIEAIRMLDPSRLELIADDPLDLTGRQHVLRRIEKRLTIMTPEQTKYMSENLPTVIEINR